MSELKNLIEQRKNTEEIIKQKLTELLDKSQYLKDKLAKLDNYEYDYLSGNDIQGVDIRVNCDFNELGLEEYPNDLVAEVIEEYVDQHGAHVNFSDKEIYHSTADELWVATHESKVILGNDWVKYQDDFHLWLLTEKHMEETGYFPGIYCQDYYGNTDEYKPEQKYWEKFPQDSKAKLAKIERYIDFYDLMESCHECNQALEEMDQENWEIVPQELKDLYFSNSVTIHEVVSVDFDKAVLNIETDEEVKSNSCKLVESSENGWYIYELTLKITPNSINFILTDDKPKGGIYEMSLLPI